MRESRPLEYVALEDMPDLGIERGDILFVDQGARFPLVITKRRGHDALSLVSRYGALEPASDSPEPSRVPGHLTLV